MAWVGLAVLATAASALIVIPGLLVAGTFGLRGVRAIGFSPALGLGVFAIWTLLWGAAGLRWNLSAWGVLVGVLLIAYVGVTLSRRKKALLRLGEEPISGALLWGGLGIATYTLIQLMVIIPAMGAPDAVPHLGDSAFHLQGTMLVARDGNVSPLGGLSNLYTPNEKSSIYYPTVWHGWTSLLVPFAGVAEATNAAVLVTGLVFWPIGVVCLASSLRPRSRLILYVAPVMLAPVATYPGALAVAYSVYPFALSLAMAPATMAATLMWQRRGKWGILTIALVSLIGSALTQPAGALFGAFALFVSMALTAARWSVASWRAGNRVPAAALTVLAGLLVGVAYRERHNGYLRSLASYPQPAIHERPLLSFVDGTVAAVSESWWPWVFVLILAVCGLIIVSRSWYGWTFIITVITFVVAYVASAGEDSLLRALTGPWYKDHLRLGSFAVALTVVSGAVGISYILERYVKRSAGLSEWPVIPAGISVTLMIVWVLAPPGISVLERAHIGNGYRLDDSYMTPLTRDTAVILSRLDDHFPEGGRLIAAYGAGGGFVGVYSDLEPMLPLDLPQTADQQQLFENLGEIGENEEICSIITEHGIVGFMADQVRPEGFRWGDLAGPPAIDVSDGFELVDQEGSVKIWRITACD